MNTNMKNGYRDIWIKDPIHGFLELDPVRDRLFLQLINSPSMQRLRRINQLGTSQFVYPGAEHSRFTHSLGTFYTAKKMLSHFYERGFVQKEKGTHEMERAILSAALLHDLGHWPFSHSFELVTNVPHERLTRAIIEGDTEINKFLTKEDKNLPGMIVSLLSHRFPISFGNAIISSQLDADRLDYICRDSYMTGANYGFLDLNRIISVLAIFDDQMVVLEKGLGTIEEYLLARFYMYWEVYYHKTSRGMTLLLGKIFQRAKELFSGSQLEIASTASGKRWDFLFQDQSKKEPASFIHDFLRIDDTDIFFLLKEFSNQRDEIIKDLAGRFLNRALFKPVMISDEKQKSVLKSLVLDNGLDPDYYFIEDERVKRIYTPKPFDLDGSQGIKIYSDSDKKIYDISEISMIIGKLGKIAYSQKKYVYIPGDVRDRFNRMS